MYAERTCKRCGATFMPKSGRQCYCKQKLIKICKYCGSTFITECSSDEASLCNSPKCKQKASIDAAAHESKICARCGQAFIPTSSHQSYCNKRIISNCVICSTPFETKCSPYINRVCNNPKCKQAFAYQQSVAAQQQNIKICAWCGAEFHPVNNTQKYCKNEHYQKCIICGKQFKVDLSKQEIPQTCSTECANQFRFHDGNPMLCPGAKEKYQQTLQERYGVSHPMHSSEIVAKVYATYQDRTGYSHPSRNPETRKNKSRSASMLEQYVANVLDNHKIKYEREYVLANEHASHSFDFYLPEYKVLVDADGIYYHGYLDDSNGYQIDEERDDVRVEIVPDDHIYIVIVESNKQADVRRLIDTIRSIDSSTYDYRSEMFKWCRSIPFPYPQYQDERLQRDYQSLCKYHTDTYNSRVKLGMSSIRHYHRSIYHAQVNKCKSVYDAWYDDKLLMKAIDNRMLYINHVDPSKILAGLYISKVAPKVSVFNPVLAKYLCEKYLTTADLIVDPFSGFSGRLLGICAAGKKYRGFDINKTAIEESNQLIQFHSLDAEVSYADIHNTDHRSYPALLTCPPYNNKETYSTEFIYHSCDDWVDLCLVTYDCNQYLFVVDTTDKYKDYIVETLVTKSYFNNITEYVVLINK